MIDNEGILVDATIVDAPCQRNYREENEQIKSGQTPEDWETKPEKNRQKDKDARWTKKHGKTFYGYKDHVKADEKSKLIVDYQVTPASEHDSQSVSELLGEQDRGQSLHADSVYVGPKIEQHLQKHGIDNNFMRKVQGIAH